MQVLPWDPVALQGQFCPILLLQILKTDIRPANMLVLSLLCISWAWRMMPGTHTFKHQTLACSNLFALMANHFTSEDEHAK